MGKEELSVSFSDIGYQWSAEQTGEENVTRSSKHSLQFIGGGRQGTCTFFDKFMKYLRRTFGNLS